MRTGFALVGISCLILVGCQSARIPVPESLVDAERLSVEGRRGFKIRENIGFGPYQAVDIRRSWTRGSDLSVQIYEGNKRVQQYTFVLTAPDADPWEIACGAFLRMRTAHFDVVDVEFENRSELDCELEAGDAHWTITLRSERQRPLSGTLRRDDHTITIEGTDRLANALSPGSTTGYTLSAESEALAAVEVVNAGAVFLHPGLEPGRRALFAATAAALLLYEDLRAHVEDD